MTNFVETAKPEARYSRLIATIVEDEALPIGATSNHVAIFHKLLVGRVPGLTVDFQESPEATLLAQTYRKIGLEGGDHALFTLAQSNIRRISSIIEQALGPKIEH